MKGEGKWCTIIKLERVRSTNLRVSRIINRERINANEFYQVNSNALVDEKLKIYEQAV